MQLMLELELPPLEVPLTYHSRIMQIGSCFTENMSERLQQYKFSLCSNPHGILFNPFSVSYSLDSYIEAKQYSKEELFFLNELWNSWDHHTKFSHINADETLHAINESQRTAANFIKNATHLIITLGSAFQYYLIETGKPVANNHRAPSQWFEKRLLTIENITAELNNTLAKLKEINPLVQVIFTISPVRHIRDGVIDNNRSKARLLESVHQLCNMHKYCHYFPAYELIIDILRDYRYYDIDFVHPNYLATTFVWEQFVKSCMDSETIELMKQVREIVTARNHRPRFPGTEAHAKFKATYAEKIKTLTENYPFISWDDELAYFKGK